MRRCDPLLAACQSRLSGWKSMRARESIGAVWLWHCRCLSVLRSGLVGVVGTAGVLAGWLADGWLPGWVFGWWLAVWMSGLVELVGLVDVWLGGWVLAGWPAGWLGGWLLDCWLGGWLVGCCLAGCQAARLCGAAGLRCKMASLAGGEPACQAALAGCQSMRASELRGQSGCGTAEMCLCGWSVVVLGGSVW